MLLSVIPRTEHSDYLKRKIDKLFEFQLKSFGYEVASCTTVEAALIAYRQDFYQIIKL